MMEYVGKQLGQYQLLRLLGRGGFASVYLGEHIHLKSLAAIKVLYTRLAEDLQENFRKEAQLLARLSHTSIIHLLDFGIDEGVPFLVMEYAPHGTLRQFYSPNVKLPLVTIVNYVNQIADGLQYAHDQKLIHRDLKPDNVLIGQQGNPLLSDFGLALIVHTTSSRGSEAYFAGTAAYMAPEQLRGEPQFASDQYALGIMVYEWLCGRRPFQGTVVELYSQHSSVPPRPLRAHVPELPVEVEQVVLKALSKDPDERFPNVKAFAAALQQASQGMQTVALQQTVFQPALPHSDQFTPPTLPLDKASTNPRSSHRAELPLPQTPSPQLEPLTSPPVRLPPSHTEPSTESQTNIATLQGPAQQPGQSGLSQAPAQQAEQSALSAAQPVQRKKSSSLSPTRPLPEIAGANLSRKKLSRRDILLLAALVLLVILTISSTTLYIFSQVKQRSAGGTTPIQMTTQGLNGSAPSSGATSTPGRPVTTSGGSVMTTSGGSVTTSGDTPSSSAASLSNSKASPTSVSSSNGTGAAAGTSSSTGVVTATAQPITTTKPTSVVAAVTPTSAAQPTPTSKPVVPTPTPAVQKCSSYNWTITGSQTGSFTTSANCSAVKVTFSGGLLSHVTIQACTSSGCGPLQLVLLGNSVTLLSNVAPGTSFYLKTTSLLPLNGTLSGVVSC